MGLRKARLPGPRKMSLNKVMDELSLLIHSEALRAVISQGAAIGAAPVEVRAVSLRRFKCG